MFIKRELTDQLLNYASKFPVVAVVGPRQSGKTTLTQQVFADHKYFSLEDPDTLERVRADPRHFLTTDHGGKGVIIDEFQNEPQLLSYMQGVVDHDRRPGYFILTGSHNFLMNQAISQSLAGRVALLTLLPLSLTELTAGSICKVSLDEAIFTGGYPDLFVRNLVPLEFYSQYSKTYVERDVKQLMNIVSNSDFIRFMRLCAGRIGQILNVSSLADDCGVSVPTVKAWLSILEASYVIFLLQPHFKNFSKRLIKSPKLYFYDTGLACWLLKISSTDQLHDHYLRGGLAESLIIAELQKSFFNRALEPSTYFWRDSHGHEVDCLLDFGSKLVPVEIKSGMTINTKFFDALQFWCELAGVDQRNAYLVYAGDEAQTRANGMVVSWRDAGDIVRAFIDQ